MLNGGGGAVWRSVAILTLVTGALALCAAADFFLFGLAQDRALFLLERWADVETEIDVLTERLTLAEVRIETLRRDLERLRGEPK